MTTDKLQHSPILALARCLIAILFATLWCFALDRLAATILALPTNQNWTERFTFLSAMGLVQICLCAAFFILFLASYKFKPQNHSRIWAVILGVLCSAVAFIPFQNLAQELTTGDWISQQPYAGKLKFAILVAGVFGTFILFFIAYLARKSRIFAALCLVASLAFTYLDTHIFVGLYRDFHSAISAFTLIFAFLAFQIWLQTISFTLKASVLSLCFALPFVVAMPVIWSTYQRPARAGLLMSSPISENLLPLILKHQNSDLLYSVLSNLSQESISKSEHYTTKPHRAPNQYNIILIVIDTLRYDALPPHRDNTKDFAKDGDTPNLDRWISESVEFTHGYTQGSRTMYSMPYLMRSLEPFEDPNTQGEPVASLMRRHGRIPIAVVPHYFLIPMDENVQDILDGFQSVEFIPDDHMDQTTEKALNLLEQSKDQPFFAWIHYYQLHQPGFADGHLLTKKDCDSIPSCYRKSLADTDRQIGLLADGLQRLGLYENTIIAISADHGEGMGERGRFAHGANTLEHAVRTNIILRMPGQKPMRDDHIVGNIDLIPTFIDAIGADPEPALRGESLLTLIDDPSAKWDRSYGTQNGNGMEQAFIDGNDKLVLRQKSGTVVRFNLKDDPDEAKDLHDPKHPTDQKLAMSMFMRNPNLARRELLAETPQGKQNRELLERLVQELTPETAENGKETLRFITSLVNLHVTKSMRSQLATLFQNSSDDVRLALVSGLTVHKIKEIESALERHLRFLQATPEKEALFVQALASQSHAPFALPYFAQRLNQLLEDPENHFDTLLAYFNLTKQWDKPATLFENSSKLLANSDFSHLSVIDRFTWLSNVIRASRNSTLSEEISEQIRDFLKSDSPSIAVAAANVLKAFKHTDNESALLETMFNQSQDLRVRQAALKTLGATMQSQAVENIIKLGEEPQFIYDAICLLESMGYQAESSLRWLRNQAKNNAFGINRRAAKRAADAISKKVKEHKKNQSNKANSKSGQGSNQTSPQKILENAPAKIQRDRHEPQSFPENFKIKGRRNFDRTHKLEAK